jgi:hypothetical protein
MPSDYSLKSIKEASEIVRMLPDKEGIASYLQPSTLFLSNLREHSDRFPKEDLSAIYDAFIQLLNEAPQEAYGLLDRVNSDWLRLRKKYGELCATSASKKDAMIAAFSGESESIGRKPPHGIGDRAKALESIERKKTKANGNEQPAAGIGRIGFNLKDEASIDHFLSTNGKDLSRITDKILCSKPQVIPERTMQLAKGDWSCFDRPETGETVIHVNEVSIDQAKDALEELKRLYDIDPLGTVPVKEENITKEKSEEKTDLRNKIPMNGVTPAMMKSMLEQCMYTHENGHGRLRTLSNSQAVAIDPEFLVPKGMDATGNEPVVCPSARELKEYASKHLERVDLMPEQRVFFENLPKYQILTGVDAISEGLAFYVSVKALEKYSSEQLARSDLTDDERIFFENLPIFAWNFDKLRSKLSLEHSVQYQNETEEVRKELESGLTLVEIIEKRLKDPDNPPVRTRITGDDLVPVAKVNEFDDAGHALIDGLEAWYDGKARFPEGEITKMLTTMAYGMDSVSSEAGYVSSLMGESRNGLYNLQSAADDLLIGLCEMYSCEDKLFDLMTQKVPRARTGLEE